LRSWTNPTSVAPGLPIAREFQPVQVSPVPPQEKRVVVLIPAEQHAMPAGKKNQNPFIVQRQGLLD
jgi:hypothetical protein